MKLESLTSFEFLTQAALLCAVVLGVFLPDEQLLRYKLIAIETGLSATLFFWVLGMTWTGKFRLNKGKLNTMVLTFVCINVSFYLFSKNKPLAYSELSRVLCGAFAFLAGGNVLRSTNARKRLVCTLSISAGLIACYGILQHTGGLGRLDVPKMDRVMGTFGNPIFFGAFLAISIPSTISAMLFQYKRPYPVKVVFLACLAVEFIALYFTKTRASWIGTAAAIFVMLFMVMRVKKARIILLIASGLLAIVLVKTTHGVWQRDQGHLLIWRDTVRMWLDNPVFGVGTGEFHIHFPSYAGDDLKAKWPQGQMIINYAHNEYLQTLAETGLAGASAFAGIIIAFVIVCLHILRDGSESYLILGVLGSGIALLTQNIFSVDMRFTVSFAYFFILAGLAASSDDNFLSFEFKIPAAAKAAMTIIFVLGGSALCREIFKPYMARQTQLAKPDFFKEKLLEPAKTVEKLKELAKEYPNDPLVFEKLGYACAKEIKTDRTMADKAINAFKRATELDPMRWGAYNNVGNIYFTMGQRDKACEFWQRSIAVKPNQIDARLNLGKALYLSGKLKESVEQFRKTLELDPNNAEAQIYLRKMVE